ncbi:proline-, glutamic acid- and leucine-rich protein 1-like [Asbolus verrucosus]|uniref:Proline-, glutamic acid-and leucine-rich protein 1-like n=1 Tax=Asbolus verrucosus TaxID=1661398 RepID=A0A482WAI2_ASBVE|nr:proline-, glutamic acid- and leucine-rich protein 1-like [Asbolus verrucosus]
MPLTLNQLKLMILSPNSDSLESTVHMLRGNIHDKENEKNIILVINSLLSNSKTRGTGLELINELIPYCSVEVLIENIMFWSSNCVVHLNTQDSLKEIKLRTIEKIIGNMAEVESFNKKFIQEYLFDTVKACLTYHCNTEKSACLKCLSQCMKIYPSWFGNHSEKIESFLIKLLEDTNGEVKDAALVFHLFNQMVSNNTGSAGVDGIHHINNFRNRFQKLCATVHALYNTFFENIREINNSERVDAEVFTFSYSQPNSDSHRFLEATAFRIINCLLFIKTMIANHSSLLPFSHALSKIILNTLKRTNSCSCFVNDSNSVK